MHKYVPKAKLMLFRIDEEAKRKTETETES
jgi:hypothetical protein